MTFIIAGILVVAASNIVEVPPQKVLEYYEPFADCVMKSHMVTDKKTKGNIQLVTSEAQCSGARKILVRNAEIYAFIELEVAKLDPATMSFVEHMSRDDKQKIVDGRLVMWLNVMDQRLKEIVLSDF